jgi:hypothetical protein
VIGLGLRLTLNGGREAAVRLAVTAIAVALGVGMLLITLAGLNALAAQNDRAAWLDTGPQNSRSGGTTAGPGSVWWLVSTDQFGGQSIYRVDVAATGGGSPVPPGLPRLPGPGQFYASPALSALLRTTPADELGERFAGKQAGLIGPSALPAPNTLVIVIGYTAGRLSRVPGAALVSSIATVPGSDNATAGYSTTTLEFLLAIGALALFFPVLIFIGTATRLAAARREQRFAAMRLVGATPRQVSVLCAVEASVAALAGVALGFAAYFLLHPVLLAVPSFTGEPFAPGDLSLGLADVLCVAIGIPAACAVAARLALRRVQISPLGVTRRATPPAPRAWRLIPLLAGLGELAYFTGIGPPRSSGGQLEAYFLGFLLVMAGLVVAGPWLVMAGALAMTRHARRAAALIAGRRLADNPRAAFRSISGLILALFVTSVSIAMTTTIVAGQSTPAGTGAAARATLADSFVTGTTASGQPLTAVASIAGATLAALRSLPGVQGVAVIHTDPQAATTPRENENTVPGLALCAQLAGTPALGRCAAGASIVSIVPDLTGAATNRSQAGTTWPAAALSGAGLSGAGLARLPVETLIVSTNGSAAAIDRAATALEIAFPGLGPPATLLSSQDSFAELQHLTDVVILVSLVIAGCSLAVSVAAGLIDRKRPFSLLRLTGAPLGVLRHVIALESVVPLVVIAVISAGTGLLASDLFLRSELGESLRPPGLGYYLIVLAGLAASLVVIASTLPLLERITGPESARNE